MKTFMFRSLMLLMLFGLAACAPETTSETTVEGGGGAGESQASSSPIEVAGDFPAASFEQAVSIRAVDHAKGADDPILTIIEYGDFQ